jgi:hypothetical protein
MNPPDRPLSPDTLDELISADIDGELDRAATDLGIDPQAARTAIDNAPGAAARRAVLLRARDVLSTRPPLDAERETTLVANALAATDTSADRAPAVVPLRRRQSARAWRAIAAAGAAAAVIAGIVVVAGTQSEQSSKSSTGAGAVANAGQSTTKPEYARARGVISFGDVSDRGALSAKIRNRLGPAENAPATVPVPAQLPASTTFTGAKGGEDVRASAAADAATRSSRAALQDCITSLRRSAHLTSAPVLSGSGTAAARPVFVVVFPGADGRVAYVLSASDCSVVSRVAVP